MPYTLYMCDNDLKRKGLYIKRKLFSYLYYMEIFYHFDCSMRAVFLVNGVFFENISKLKSEFADSLYITVLPLDALYLPYTVRIGGGEVFANDSLTTLYRLRDNRYYVRLLPRLNYVYTPRKHEAPPKKNSPALRLFTAVKQKETAEARALLTPALSASVDDNSLLGFFDGYRDMVENDNYVGGHSDSFFLIPEEEKETAAFFKIDYVNGLIDNLSEI